MSLALRFLGTGDARATALGSASAVLEVDGQPTLLIDCGPTTLDRYEQQYQRLPTALFVTHCHMDHIGGIESLFYRAWFDPARSAPVRMYLPLGVVPILHRRIADFPSLVADDGVNFWDAFQLIVVSEEFFHAGLRLRAVPVRHHAPGTSFGLALARRFFYTGDTRPIPEVLDHHALEPATVFHDCGLRANASHTGLEDLALAYSSEQRARMVLYHYANEAAGLALEGAGYRVARPGAVYSICD